MENQGDKKEIVFRANKRMLFGGILFPPFVCFATWTYILKNPISKSHGIDLIALLFAITLFCMAVIYFFWCLYGLISRKPLMILNSTEFYSSKTGYLKWKDIQKFEIFFKDTWGARYKSWGYFIDVYLVNGDVVRIRTVYYPIDPYKLLETIRQFSDS